MKLLERLLNESPDKIRIADIVLEYDHAKAKTFCFIGDDYLAVSDRTHIFIFNALRAFKKSKSERGKADYKVFNDYGVKFLPSRPPEALLLETADILVSEMGENRFSTYSGRVWPNLRSDSLGEFSAVSFWTTSTAPGMRRKLSSMIHILKIGDEPFYVEFLDSQQPEVFNMGSGTGGLISKTNPNLTASQIAEILKRAHIDKESLSKEERKVVDEFRPRVYKDLFKEPMVSIRSKTSTSESKVG